MKTQYKFIYFDIQEESGSVRYKVWVCRNRKNGLNLGRVAWYSAWKQYCFFPTTGCVFNRGCMDDINDFIRQAEELRKKE